MINVILWILFGALAGWIASILTGKNRRMGGIANIVVGILGAFIGSGILQLAGYGTDMNVFSFTSLLVAIFGAVVLILVVGFLFRR